MRIRNGIGLSVSLEEVAVERKEKMTVLHTHKEEMDTYNQVASLDHVHHHRLLAGDLPSHPHVVAPQLLFIVPNPLDDIMIIFQMQFLECLSLSMKNMKIKEEDDQELKREIIHLLEVDLQFLSLHGVMDQLFILEVEVIVLFILV